MTADTPPNTTTNVVNVVIIEAGRALLTRRTDFHVWCLPGGYIDPGETPAQAAIRETHEEIGVEVALRGLVGVYSRPNWTHGDYLALVFAAQIVNGTLSADPAEVARIAFFPANDLPEMMVGHRVRLMDALAGYGGSIVRHEAIPYPAGLPHAREALYALKDRSEQTPDAFYRQHFIPAERAPGRIEVAGRPGSSLDAVPLDTDAAPDAGPHAGPPQES